MFFQQFRQDGVFSLELGLQLFDLLIARIGCGSFGILERGGPVLEEQLLPVVKDGGLELILLTDLGDRYLVDQMSLENLDLLGRRIMLSWFAHAVFLRSLSC